MRLGFYNTYEGGPAIHIVLADKMIRSAREHLPGVEIVQFTDEESPAIAGVDTVLRMPHGPLALATARHYARTAPGDWLLVDTDVVIQRDVRDVFEDQDFDVAVCDRGGTLVAGETNLSTASGKFMDEMPYNIGVVFSRAPDFWAAVADGVAAGPAKDQHWMANQRVACRIIKACAQGTGVWRIKVLPCAYNFAPTNEGDDVSGAAIVHYKGPTRKAWMLNRLKRELECASA